MGQNSLAGQGVYERLKIIIVGAGLGGLAAAYCLGRAGHDVLVLESSSEPQGNVGAGIQICPNMTRILRRWGLQREIEQILRKDQPDSWSFYRYRDGEFLGKDILGDQMEQTHGSPWFVCHRSDLYKMLLSLATPFMTLKLKSKVKAINPSTPSPYVILENGATYTGDLIVGADGIHSVVRDCIGSEMKTNTGDMAYRTLISTEAFRSDPLLRDLVEKPRISCWIGPKKHVIGYCVNGGKEYNMVLLTPDDDSTNSTSDLDEARTAFADWEPRIQKLLSLTRTVMKTKLMVCAPLKTWTHPSGGVTLLGDACHPMLPYRAQGAAMAIEDAAILGNLFARLTNRAQISMLLELYEEIRHDRVAAVQMASLDNRRLFHMEDGPEQETRDLGMRIGFPGATPWSDRDKTVRLLGYDTDQVTEGWWTAHKH